MLASEYVCVCAYATFTSDRVSSVCVYVCVLLRLYSRSFGCVETGVWCVCVCEGETPVASTAQQTSVALLLAGKA